MKKTLSDILCALAMTAIAVVACAALAVAVGLCAGIMACVVLPIVGCCVWGWSGWWCALYAIVTVAIYLVIRHTDAAAEP